MSNNWRKAYLELTDFIAEHSEVEIEASRVRLSDNVRPEFYRLFNMVRTAFVEEKFPDLLNEATSLSRNYLRAEQEVTELLGLEDVSMEADLRRFLHDPIDELRRELFDPLFDLLKGKEDRGTFEERASQNIEASYRVLYLSGYEKWAALSLVKLLRGDKLFQVTLPKLDLGAKMQMAYSKERVPPPKESKHLSFEHELDPMLIVPDFIVHSTRVNRYAGVRSEYEEAKARASGHSEDREWYSLDSVVALGLGLTLVYVADNPEEISLVADKQNICRPDLIIECREEKGWYEKGGLENVKLHHDSLKPTLGTYIVSREPVPEQAYKGLVPEQVCSEPAPKIASSESATERIVGESTPEQEPEKHSAEIHILTVGFDQSKLEPIISSLMKQEDEEQ